MLAPPRVELRRAAAHPLWQPERCARVGDFVHLGPPPPGAWSEALNAAAVDALPLQSFGHAVGARDRVRLRCERDPDLVRAAVRHLQRRRGTDPRVEDNRAYLGTFEERGDSRSLLRVAREVEVAVAAEDRAVDKVRDHACDPVHALWRDRVPLHVETFEAERGDLGGDLLGDGRRADAEHDLARADELLDRADVVEGRLCGTLGRCLAAAVARPDDFGAGSGPDRRPHASGEEQPDAHQSRSTREPPMITSPPSAKRTSALPLPS